MHTSTLQTWMRRLMAGLSFASAVALTCGTAGCARHHDVDTFVKDPMPVVGAKEYRLAPPDVVSFSSRRVRELDGQGDTIRPDGKVTLPLLGSVFIAGLTPEEASEALAKIAREFYQDADVTVRVAAFNSKKIYVWGQVAAPGPYAYDGTNTVFRTLAMAQPTHLSDKTRIEVLRPNRDGKLVKKMTIDLDDMVEEGIMARNGILEEGDVIYVPANALAAVGLVLQQVLLPIQPAAQTVQGPSDIGLISTGRRPYGQSQTSP